MANSDYILVRTDDWPHMAVLCGSQSYCRAQAVWLRLKSYEIVYAPPPPPGWTDELTGVTYS